MMNIKYSLGNHCVCSDDNPEAGIGINWKRLILLLTFSLAITFLCFHSRNTFAGIYGPPFPASPCNGGQSVTDATGACYEESPGNWLYRAGQKLSGSNNFSMVVDFDKSYVPYAGIWSMRAHFCPTSKAGHCTLKDSQLVTYSINSVYLNSSQRLVDQNPNFGGATGVNTLPWDASMCLTFVDDANNEWSTPADRTCQDAHVMPDYPATCYINYGEDLNVDLGVLERSEIATAPLTTETVKKTVPVMCSGDAAITVSMAFQYTAININGEQVVSSSTPHLGVAVIHNGHVVDPSETYQATYQPGISNLDLEFEAVRDPNVANGDIKAGAFTASATLIMTQQ